jgi:tRNA G18 (ribose-2'-O)-methylase SpoU
MELHIPTLALVAVFVTAILGALLLLASRRDQSTQALVWWGAGYLVGGGSFSLIALRGAIPDVLSIEVANALLLLCYSFLLAGARAFGGRDTPVTAFLIAPLIWLTAMTVPAIADNINARVVVISTMQAAIVALVAFEFWRGRAEPLLSRWPAIILLFFHTAVLSMRMVVVTVTPITTHHDLFRSQAFAIMAFGTVLYTVTLAFVLLSMSKERSELRHKIAALVDPLTGLANRRAFMLDAEAAITRRASRSEPFAVQLADLDRNASPIWLVAERLRDPGNLGTILRTGDAVGAGGLILIDECVDPLSVEAVRASMGALFTVPVARASWGAFRSWLRSGPGQLVGLSLDTELGYRAPDYARPVFLLTGNEAQGMPDFMAAECDLLVKIPMLGKADSLNAAVATAVMAYEVLNQRRR